MEAGSSYRTIYINDKPYACDIENYDLITQFLNRVTQGDATRDSDRVMSSKIYTSFVGGTGIDRARESIDEGRFWFGDLETRFPYQLSLGNQTVEVENVSYPMGTLAGTTYLATNTDIYAWNESTKSIGSSIATFADPPVYRGVAFDGDLYIPQGSNGHQTFDGAALGTQNTTVLAHRFAIWNNALFAITTDNKLYKLAVGGSWTLQYTLHSSVTVRGLVNYMDSTGNDSLYITTTTGVLAWDADNSIVVNTRLSELPEHPDVGLGVCMWRVGEDLFMSAGLQIYRWTISAVAPYSGPSADEGLPQEYRGRIVDLAPELSGMYALIEGTSELAAYTVQSEDDPGLISENLDGLSISEPSNLLMVWNGSGWHVAHAPSGSGAATWIHVAGNDEAYRVWWGCGTSCFTQKLSRTFLNPRQRLESGEGLFQPTGHLTTAKYDANMFMFDKLASHIAIYTEDFDAATQTLSVEYRTEAHGWQALGGVTAEGRVEIPFGEELLDDGTYFSRGEVFKWIQFRITMTSSDETKTPIMDNLVLYYIKVPIQVAAFTVNVELKSDLTYDRTAEEIKEEIDQLAESPAFIRLQHGGATGKSHRVYVTRVAGPNLTGTDQRAIRKLTFAQIRLDGYEGRPSEEEVVVA